MENKYYITDCNQIKGKYKRYALVAIDDIAVEDNDALNPSCENYLCFTHTRTGYSGRITGLILTIGRSDHPYDEDVNSMKFTAIDFTAKKASVKLIEGLSKTHRPRIR